MNATENLTQFAVGEIVKIVTDEPNDKHNGYLCFVEEVVTEPRNATSVGGRYSLYGLDKPNPAHKWDLDFGRHPSHWYFGDYIGKELESTGRLMTVADLNQYRVDKGMIAMYSGDIDFIIVNLGASVHVPRPDRRMV